jgi:predicted molibdopterin-dependent oxidoreductase YjgC
MRSVTPSYAGITYARLDERGIQWPCPNTEHPGTPILHGEKFSRGLGKFNAVEHVNPDEMPDEEFPLILDTGRRLYHYHTGAMSRKGMLNEQMPHDYLEINCADAERFGIGDGDQVRVISRRGAMEIRAQISDVVPPGIVFSSFHFTETPVNRLTNPKLDPISKIPELKICAVKVEKIA